MSEQSHLDQLVSLWQEEAAKGNDLSPEALCWLCPELVPEFVNRIQELRQQSCTSAEPHVVSAPPDEVGQGKSSKSGNEKEEITRTFCRPQRMEREGPPNPSGSGQ